MFGWSFMLDGLWSLVNDGQTLHLWSNLCYMWNLVFWQLGEVDGPQAEMHVGIPHGTVQQTPA